MEISEIILLEFMNSSLSLLSITYILLYQRWMVQYYACLFIYTNHKLEKTNNLLSLYLGISCDI